MARSQIFPFDVELFRQGGYVACTKKHRPVQLFEFENDEEYPLKGMIAKNRKPSTWTIQGKWLKGKAHNNDLMMKRL